MEKLCNLCGTPLNDNGVCENSHSFKKMCVNCSFVEFTDNGYICTNEDNMKDAKTKMVEAAQAVAGGYSFNLEVKPLPLKRPCAKCGRWTLSKEIIDTLIDSFE